MSSESVCDSVRVISTSCTWHLPCLPSVELYSYMVLWTGGVLYSAFAAFQASQEHSMSLNSYDFEEGWQIIGRKKDISDFEWTFWTHWFIHHILKWYIGHILLSRVVDRKLYTYRSYFFTLYGVVALGFVMGPKLLFFTVLQCTIIYLIAAVFKSVIIIWITALMMLSILNIEITTKWLKLACGDDSSSRTYYLAVFTLAMTNLRYISFCIEMVRGQQQQKQLNFMDMMTYIFYFPLFFTGPHITYDLFREQLQRPLGQWTKQKYKQLFVRTAKLIFWCVTCELILHYVYFSSILYHEQIMKTLPLWALAGVGFWNGQFFMLKYVVMFGIPKVCASLDFIDVAEGPKCISRITLYSQMWKSFDRGLYSFLKRYIYIPLGGSRQGLLRQLLASLLSFTFIYVWHGTENHLFVWVALNFVGISLEVLAAKIITYRPVQSIKNRLFSGAVYERLVGLSATLLFTMSCTAIFIFFGGTRIGLIFYKRLLFEGWPLSTVTTLFFLYCGVQTSKIVDLWEKKSKLE